VRDEWSSIDRKSAKGAKGAKVFTAPELTPSLVFLSHTDSVSGPRFSQGDSLA